MVRYALGCLLRLLLVVLVQLLNIQTATTLMHVDLSVHGRLNLDRLCTVSLLRIQLATVHIIDGHQLSLMVLAACGAVGRRNNGLTGWVVAKVRLVHQLLVEGRVHVRVVVLDGLLMGLADLGPVLEELVENGLLLVVLDAHTLALDRTALGSKHKTYDGQAPFD